MNIFDIQKDHLWRHGNIMKFGLSLGQAIEYFRGLESKDMFNTLGMFYDGHYVIKSKPLSCQRS
jgi:hypothetical protein